MNDRSSRPSDARGYDGPWSNLPPEASTPKPAREPFLRKRKGAREPIVRNWKGIAIIVFLLFVAPAVCAWISRLIMSSMGHG